MPGNELGDRVHNFFAQDNSSQGQHQSHVLEGNWPVLNNNFWVGSQRQIDVLNSSSKNYSSQNSEIDRGQASYPAHATHGSNFSQSNLRPDLSKNQSLIEQQYSNGFMHGNQFYQTRQNEANFLAVDTDSDQRHLLASRGLSVHESQQGSGHEQQPKASDRSESYVPPVSFDLFGGQPQMSHQQASMLQALQRQQSGINDMQQLQQQLMIRKMQELQRQQQLRQLDLRPQNLINQVPPFTKQASGSQPSTLVNGAPNSDALQYPWTAEPGTNWLSRGSSAMQGSPSGLAFPPNLGQTQRLMDLVPQQVDQSLYGVPVSSSRGLAVNQYSQMVTDRSLMPQMATSSNSLHGNQHNFLPDQIGGQEGTSISRQKFQDENIGHASSQSLKTGMMDRGGLQQVNSMQRNSPQQDFLGRQDLAIRSETSHERSTRQVSSSRSEVALDPTEEKILYGSDDNIWAAFGKSPNMSGEAGNLFENGGSSNGFPSIQSGSWSALMQSAVAETSSNDIRPQEEWSGLIFHNTDNSSANQPPSMHNDNVKQASLPDDNMRIPSALSSGSIPTSVDINTLNVMGLNQLGHKFQNEFGQRVPTDTAQRLGQSSEEASKWSKRSPLQKSVAEGSQIYGNASQNSLDAERNAKTGSATWAAGQSGTRQEPNGWNALAAVPPGGDRVLNIHEADLSQNSQNNQLRGEVGHGSSLWKSNSVTSSAIEFGPMKSAVGNYQANKGILSLNDATASVANSCNMGVGDGASPFVQNNNLLNQWKNAYPSPNPKGVNEHNQGLYPLNSCDKDEVTRHDLENCAMKENSNDSHRSNLSQHASGGFRESGLSDASDSRSLPPGKQKSTNQLASKVSVPRKFQYHPMGNLDEDVELTYGLKQPTQVQAISQQNTHFGQLSQISRYYTVTDKGELPKGNKGSDEELSRGSFPGYAPRMSFPFSQPFDSHTPNKASPPSQNMLELLHKVDQSRDNGAAMHLSSSECNVSSQLPEADKFGGSAGRVQHSRFSVSQGFGLQLGPPSQRLQIPDLSSPSQNAQGSINSMHTSHAGEEMGEKGLLMVPTSSVQSLPFPNEESQIEFENDRSAGNENSLYKAPGNYHPALSSDTPYAKSQLQNKQITRVSGKMATNEHIDSSFSCNTSRSMQRGFAETVLPVASRNIQKDNLASSGGMAQQSGPYDVLERGPAATASTWDQMRSSQHFGVPGISQQGTSGQGLQNTWTNVPTSQHTLAAQYLKAPSHFSELPQPNIVESSPQGDLDVSKVGHLSSKLTATHANSPGVVDREEHRLKESSGRLVSFVNIDSAPKMEESQGKASSIKNHLDDSPANSPANSPSTQKDIEAFGRSLKPNIFPNKKYALLNQMRDLKDVETDPSIRVSKRIKGPDNVLDVRQVHMMAGQQNEDNVGDSLGSSTGVPSEDSRMLSFSTPSDILQRNSSPHGNVASQEIVAVGLDASRGNLSSDCTTSVRVEHHQVSPQMVPSWFNQYGSFKNGQMLPIYNAPNVTSLRPEEPPVTLGKFSSVLDAPNLEENSTAAHIDACQVGSTLLNSAPTMVANGHLSSPQSLQLNVTGQHQVILRPQKRKSATSELHPWYREISDASQNISILSVAEADWNKVANCLTEKVEDDAELIEDGPPLLRSKRRLILTTQLMQQLFRPPPATILSADASSKYESVTYAVSRAALGHACSAVSRSSDFGLPRDCMNVNSVKGKLNGDPHFAKVIEELLGKARKLENDFLRLDKSASILDLRVECQDLEKFSVINRFAKFHARGQTDNAETSSTDAAATTQKPCAQRYVTAVPMPRSLPDRVQCLSL
ncbi:hypothetical protein Pfo_020568 [Paulownia fortunei]|nr:hypothetical protein Pfo_020568 [Paulownia fortunei]